MKIGCHSNRETFPLSMEVAPQSDLENFQGFHGRARAQPEVIELSDSEDEVFLNFDEIDEDDLPQQLRSPGEVEPVIDHGQRLPPPARHQPAADPIDVEADPPHYNDIGHGAEVGVRAEWGGYIHDDLDVEDPELDRLMMEEFAHIDGPAWQASQLRDFGAPQQVAVPTETKDDCFANVNAIFPGICMDHVTGLYDTVAQSSERLIAHILDKGPYPTAKDAKRIRKRKRDLDEDEEAAKKYGAADRIVPTSVGGPRPFIRHILSFEFPLTPVAFIDAAMKSSGGRLYSAYRVLAEAARTYDEKPPYNKLKAARKGPHHFLEENLEAQIQKASNDDPEQVEVLQELQAARRAKSKDDDRRAAVRAKELEEEGNLRQAEAEGTMGECACCYCDYALNRMVHCNNEDVMHWFCRGCALKHAETEIGNSKYLLQCMSMDGCESGFSMEQRFLFLDAKTTVALERNEQEAVLRLAGIENLASCPFCPFAAEYLPVEVDREFRCQAPDCEMVSCRLCNLESHIPKSCDENARDNGLSVRRQIEEAMTAALIRRCNKCNTPFVKDEGCNKMTCTRNGCGNIQCYVCSKSCDYSHFNDRSRGGRDGQCPLFEVIEDRHEQEVSKAEREALDRIQAEHPEYSEEDLKIKVSEAVQNDDEARRRKDPRYRMVAGGQARRQAHDLNYPFVHALPDFEGNLRRPGRQGAHGVDDMHNIYNVAAGAPRRPQGAVAAIGQAHFAPVLARLPFPAVSHRPQLREDLPWMVHDGEFARGRVAQVHSANAGLNAVKPAAEERLNEGLERVRFVEKYILDATIPVGLPWIESHRNPFSEDAGRAYSEVAHGVRQAGKGLSPQMAQIDRHRERLARHYAITNQQLGLPLREQAQDPARPANRLIRQGGPVDGKALPQSDAIKARRDALHAAQASRPACMTARRH